MRCRHRTAGNGSKETGPSVQEKCLEFEVPEMPQRDEIAEDAFFSAIDHLQKEALSDLLAAMIAEIGLGQHLGLALWACDIGLFNPSSANHTELSLRWEVLVACMTSVDHDHLVSAVGTKPGVHADGGMTLWTGDGLLPRSLICHGFLEYAREHHAEACADAQPKAF